ncbi:DUF2254 domain-containing protein [Ramlibacter sp. USB13]|uniref:DUF2254 domain-containing protein n=1 Tax=Ramlibacter cellulosilyticus TaxID=2764187 RepID=A0A923MQI2_9BURK|nr:DUF2254 domain-containing protein [Ramlibacter cellulosilyticus]MBC5783096.1 DUF2254 domain-containing protein [Ramlibacter cellulosilyticus]
MPLPRLWLRLRASFWFTPALIVLASAALAALLVELDVRRDADLANWSPRLFGAGADGSRGMLTAIATSMVTVAGVVFSITIVTLSLTATQYSPRVLRSFMRDTPTQVVLGIFVGIFAYCLLVLRTIRGGDEGAFIPSFAVIGGMGYALVGIAVLIYFIHHVALSIQAASIIDRIATDTGAAIDLLFPQALGEDPPRDEATDVDLPVAWVPVPAHRSGYVQSVDGPGLLRLAARDDRVVRLCGGIGAYRSEGDALLQVSGGPLGRTEEAALRACIGIGRQRTVEQDVAFGLEQLVDVALRALSPGVNDPSTARMCLHAIGTLLGRLAGRATPPPFRFADGQLRVVAPAADFGTLAAVALRPILHYGAADPDVMDSAVAALEAAFARAGNAERRRALAMLAREFHPALARMRPRRAATQLRARLRGLQARMGSTAGADASVPGRRLSIVPRRVGPTPPCAGL